MTPHQKIFALLLAIGLMVLIIDLVRRRKLRVEYSVLWVLTSIAIFVLVAWYDLLVWITRFIGAVLPTTTLFLFGVFFIVLICLHFSIKNSALTNRLKELAQHLAILDSYIEKTYK